MTVGWIPQRLGMGRRGYLKSLALSPKEIRSKVAIIKNQTLLFFYGGSRIMHSAKHQQFPRRSVRIWLATNLILERRVSLRSSLSEMYFRPSMRSPMLCRLGRGWRGERPRARHRRGRRSDGPCSLGKGYDLRVLAELAVFMEDPVARRFALEGERLDQLHQGKGSRTVSVDLGINALSHLEIVFIEEAREPLITAQVTGDDTAT